MIRTGYSFRKAVGHLPDVISRVKEVGWSVLPIADTCSTFAFVQGTKQAKAAGLRPVYGVRINVSPSLGGRWPALDEWVFLAKDRLGPLHELVGRATIADKEPRLTYSQALETPGLVKVSGERLLLDCLKELDTTDFYVGLSPATPKGLYREALARGHSFCATSCNLYPRREDAEFYKVSMPVTKRGNEFFSTATTQTYPLHILSDAELLEATAWFTEREDVERAICHRDAVLESCRAELKKAELLVPPKPITLLGMCEDGADRLGVDLTDPVYRARLERELSVIAEKKFEDYFYIIADLVSWARERMVVGPARGSSCGSLVCYLIGITTIDPIPYKLVFERFIDVTREDLPDIDIDFSDVNRHLVLDYAAKKYGEDHVARLGSVGSFQPKSALNQVASALRIPGWRIDRVTAGVIKRAMGDSRASQTLEDTLTNTDVGKEFMAEYPEAAIVSRLEDHPTAAGQHAAGVVITRLPVTEHVAVDSRTGAIMADKKDAEALDLLKIDALGLTQLSVFERTLELIGEKPKSGFLEKLPLDDPEAFDVLNRRHFSGIFQFTGQAVQGVTRQIVVDKFDDLVAITALARPGPLGGGGTNEWVLRRTGKARVTYPHPAFEPYLRDTLGIVVYQEQVLAIGREIGDLSWAEVTKLRQAMSRSLGKEFFDLHGGNKWKARAVEKGIPEPVVLKMWEDLCTFGMWAFNAAHSVAYGMVSYWAMWLKAHHPVEFAAATLDAEKDPARQIGILRELAKEGTGYVSVDPEHSEDRWRPAVIDGRSTLVGPLSSIVGIGDAAVAEIMASRKNGKELRPALLKRLHGAKTSIDSLWPIRDRVDQLSPKNIVSVPTPIEEIPTGANAPFMIIAVATRIAPLNENEPARVAKRDGRRVEGPENALNLFVRDDTDEMFCKVHRDRFEEIGRDIAERGGEGKSIYAIKGWVPDGDFRMMWVRDVRYLGSMSASDDAPREASAA